MKYSTNKALRQVWLWQRRTEFGVVYMSVYGADSVSEQELVVVGKLHYPRTLINIWAHDCYKTICLCIIMRISIFSINYFP